MYIENPLGSFVHPLMMNILARKFLKSDLKKYQEDMFGMGVPATDTCTASHY